VSRKPAVELASAMPSFRLLSASPNAAVIVTEESGERRTAFLPECRDRDTRGGC
jgi:hypothetical protein